MHSRLIAPLQGLDLVFLIMPWLHQWDFFFLAPNFGWFPKRHQYDLRTPAETMMSRSVVASSNFLLTKPFGKLLGLFRSTLTRTIFFITLDLPAIRFSCWNNSDSPQSSGKNYYKYPSVNRPKCLKALLTIFPALIMLNKQRRIFKNWYHICKIKISRVQA